MAEKVDVSTLSVSDIEAMLKAKKEEQKRIVAEQSTVARQDIEAMLKKKYGGLTLADLGLVQKKAKKPPVKTTYKNPKTGELYTYKGFGGIAKDVKAWLCDKDGKRIKDFEVKTN